MKKVALRPARNPANDHVTVTDVRRCLAPIASTLKLCGVQRLWFDQTEVIWSRQLQIRARVDDAFDLTAWTMAQAAITYALDRAGLGGVEWSIEIADGDKATPLVWPLAVKIASLRVEIASLSREIEDLQRIEARAGRAMMVKPMQVEQRAAPKHT